MPKAASDFYKPSFIGSVYESHIVMAQVCLKVTSALALHVHVFLISCERKLSSFCNSHLQIGMKFA